MANFFTSAIDITPGTTGAWVDVDVSAYCPAGTTGVILQVLNTVGSISQIGLRKKGSTDARQQDLYNSSHIWASIGVDGQRILQAYRGSTNIQFKLLGYFTSDATFFLNAYDKTPGSVGVWVDVDCSVEIPAGAKFAILELSIPSEDVTGIRAKGSTDNRKRLVVNKSFALIGLDSNRVFQVYRTGASDTFHLVGYLTAGIPKVNGVNVSLGSTGAYINIDRSGDADATNAVGVLLEAHVATTTIQNFAIRKNGSTDDFLHYSWITWPVIGLDAGKILQGKISNLNMDFYVLGYLEAAPQTWEYVGNIQLSLTLQGDYAFPRTWEYVGDIPLTLLPQSTYLQEWQYQGNIPLILTLASTYYAFTGWEYVGNIPLALSLAGDYFVVLGRNSIPVPYVLRYPNPKSGQTNVPVGNPIKFIIKSDGPGIDIDTVKVKVTDSWGINIYDKTSPYFKYSGKKSRYEVEVKPPQPWAYEENVQTEIDARDLAGIPGVVYEYVS